MKNVKKMQGRATAIRLSVVSAVFITASMITPFTPSFAQETGLGETMVSGDFNYDGVDDLAVGHPFASVDGKSAAGQVRIFYGGAQRLVRSTPEHNTISLKDFSFNFAIQGNGSDTDGPTYPGASYFGFSMTVGDFNFDAYPDLAIGAPGAPLAYFAGDRASFKRGYGAVAILLGGPDGLRAEQGYLISAAEVLNETGIADEGPLNLGYSLAATTEEPWLAIGAPRATVNGVSMAGRVFAVPASTYNTGYRLLPELATLWDQSTSGIPGSASTGDQFGQTMTISDLNADGFEDLVIGAPNKIISGDLYAGAIYVLYSSMSTSITMPPDWILGTQIWHQDSPDTIGSSEHGDAFGFSLASGDFDGNGVNDLAVGVPGETVREDSQDMSRAGRVAVFYSEPEQDEDNNTLTGGLTARDQSWHQAIATVDGYSEADEEFGRSLAAGDLDGDGIDDLAIGVPSDSNTTEGGDRIPKAGSVHIFNGSASGLTYINQRYIGRASYSVAGGAGNRFHYGKSVAIGQFNALGAADLAVGTPGRRDKADSRVQGAVNMNYPSDGITPNEIVDVLKARPNRPWEWKPTPPKPPSNRL